MKIQYKGELYEDYVFAGDDEVETLSILINGKWTSVNPELVEIKE